MSEHAPHTVSPRRLRRSRENRMVAGVCGGLARHLGVDPKWVRLLTVLGVVLGLGSVAVLYLVAWVVIPQD
ncbi:PspC domain-containing protein [uncultured Nocardioides sp.]|uniref:PspC domain-containing protein n=1 Tax=uncultured Nocardioides sp. TaxID=198441 RepID=UPI0025F7E6F9|nr:PspC domain-containing protein [uncultured Nocardioides sp.]